MIRGALLAFGALMTLGAIGLGTLSVLSNTREYAIPAVCAAVASAGAATIVYALHIS